MSTANMIGPIVVHVDGLSSDSPGCSGCALELAANSSAVEASTACRT